MHGSQAVYHRKRVPDITHEVTEYIAACPCGVALDIYVDMKGRLESTIKHYQRDGAIFHKCGTDKPCRLFWGKKIQEWPRL